MAINPKDQAGAIKTPGGAAFWSKLIFTGKRKPPAEMDAAAVKQKVASDPTAVGYIDAKELDASVKEVLRF